MQPQRSFDLLARAQQSAVINDRRRDSSHLTVQTILLSSPSSMSLRTWRRAPRSIILLRLLFIRALICKLAAVSDQPSPFPLPNLAHTGRPLAIVHTVTEHPIVIFRLMINRLRHFEVDVLGNVLTRLAPAVRHMAQFEEGGDVDEVMVGIGSRRGWRLRRREQRLPALEVSV